MIYMVQLVHPIVSQVRHLSFMDFERKNVSMSKLNNIFILYKLSLVYTFHCTLLQFCS